VKKEKGEGAFCAPFGGEVGNQKNGEDGKKLIKSIEKVGGI